MDFQIEPLQNPGMQLPAESQETKRVGLILPKLPKPKWIAAVVGVILLVAVILFFMGQGSFSDRNVEVKIDGPTEISSGDLVTYKLTYKNDNKAKLTDVKLNFFYPPDAIVVHEDGIAQTSNEIIDLQEIGGGKSGEVEFRAYIIGDRGNIISARTTLTFRPESVSSLLEKSSSLSATITNLTVPITLVAPPTVINGQAISYLIDYRNQTAEDLRDLRFIVRYPEGFKFTTSNPKPSARESTQDIWDVATLKQGEGARITIQGVLNGREREGKIITVTLQRKITMPNGDVYIDFQKSEASSVIASPLLSVDVSVNGSRDYTAHLGDSLRYRINFSNNTNFDVSNLTLSAKLDGVMYEPASVRTSGFFDSRLNTVFWNGSAIPALNNLRPNQSGIAEFEVKLKPNFSGAIGARESFVKLSIHLETPNVPPELALDKLTADDELTTRISTAPTFSQSVRVNDAEWGASGPYPPRVDQKTIFTINWKLVNPANDISPAKITAVLAPGVSWENRTRASGSQPQPSYNSQTKTVTWDLGNLPGGVGVAFPAYEGFFQISITPSVNQVGQTVDLLRDIRFEGTDIFTKEKIIRTSSNASTGSVVDSGQGGSVQQ